MVTRAVSVPGMATFGRCGLERLAAVSSVHGRVRMMAVTVTATKEQVLVLLLFFVFFFLF